MYDDWVTGSWRSVVLNVVNGTTTIDARQVKRFLLCGVIVRRKFPHPVTSVRTLVLVVTSPNTLGRHFFLVWVAVTL